MNKEQFKIQGIDEDFFSEILGIPIKDYDVTQVQKGAQLRADLYNFTIYGNDGSKKVLFAKDFRPGTNISGDIRKDESKDQSEVEFLRFGTDHKAFTPKYHGHKSYSDETGVGHTIVFMEKFQQSLEDKLIELYEQKQEADTPIEKDIITNQAFEYLKRVIDINFINNNIATQHFDTSDTLERSVVYKATEESLRTDLTLYLDGLLYLNFPNERAEKLKRAFEESKNDLFAMQSVRRKRVEKVTREYQQRLRQILEEAETHRRKERRWSRENRYGLIMASLYSHIAARLGQDEERGIINFDVSPANVLLRGDELSPDYDPNAVIDLRDGRSNKTQYDNFAITDHQKIGYGPDAMIAVLLNHPSVFRIFEDSPTRLVDLAEHAGDVREKVRQGRKDLSRDEINATKEGKTFSEEYASASRLALLRNIGFMSWFNLNPELKKNRQRLQEANPLYQTKEFINANIDRFVNLDDELTPYFNSVNKGLKGLRINGAN